MGEIDAEGMISRMSSGKFAFIDPGLTMKPYPYCKCNHNIIEAINNLMMKYQFKLDDVVKVYVGVQLFFVGCLKYQIAKNPLEGKFSCNYNVALVLVNRRRPGIKDFKGDKIDDARIVNAMDKVEMVIDDSIAGCIRRNTDNLIHHSDRGIH